MIHSDGLQAETVYRASRGWRAGLVGGGGLLALGGLAGVAYFGTGHEVSGPGELWTFVVVSGVLALLGLYGVVSAFHDRLVVGDGYVVHHELHRTRRMALADLAGYRVQEVQGMRLLKLLPRDGTGKGMDINLIYAVDHRFDRWLNTLANLDERDAEAARREVESNTMLGYSPVERSARAAHAGKTAGALVAVALAVTVWSIWFPDPHRIAIAVAAALPLIAIALAWSDPHAYTLRDNDRAPAQASLFFVVLMPGFGLMVRALSDVQLVDSSSLVAPSVAGGVLLALACSAYKDGVARFMLAAALLAAYPAGMLPLANALFDTTTPQLQAAQVVSKRIARNKTITLYLGIKPEAPDGDNEVEVAEALYRQVNPGDTVCIATRSGMLRMAWFEVEPGTACASPATPR